MLRGKWIKYHVYHDLITQLLHSVITRAVAIYIRYLTEETLIKISNKYIRSKNATKHHKCILTKNVIIIEHNIISNKTNNTFNTVWIRSETFTTKGLTVIYKNSLQKRFGLVDLYNIVKTTEPFPLQ